MSSAPTIAEDAAVDEDLAPRPEAAEEPAARALTFAEVEWERAPCPLCGAHSPGEPALTGRDDVWQKEGEFTIAPCGGCGLVYTSPRPTAETMRYYYEDCYSGRKKEEMRKLAVDSPAGFFINWTRLRTIEKVRRLQEGEVVLDVGCSYGGFIEGVRKVRGIEAHAIDLDPGTIENFVNPVDVKVVCGDLREVAYPDDTFDVVTLFETLEHVYDPVELLTEVKRILKPGGLVSVEVPSWDGLTRAVFGSWWLPLLLPTHLQHFSRAHLRQCVEAAGLTPVHQQAMFLPGEVMLSLWVGVGRLIGRVDEDARSLPRKVLELFVGLWLMWVFVFIDVPTVFVLSLLGRSGHQTLVAKKALPEGDREG